MAAQDRGAMGVIAAQIGQAQAQLALVQERLARATLVAPFDGVVVSGDLSQQIGSPVEQGRVLFEVAPLGGYRVILQVDERDIAAWRSASVASWCCRACPDRRCRSRCSQITPVATQQDGRNFFRVEAQLEGTAPRLRPGMEGVGKVVGRRAQPALDLDPRLHRLAAPDAVELDALNSPHAALPASGRAAQPSLP